MAWRFAPAILDYGNKDRLGAAGTFGQSKIQNLKSKIGIAALQRVSGAAWRAGQCRRCTGEAAER
jgi:hypothetical protein